MYMPQKYNSSPSIGTFDIGGLVSLRTTASQPYKANDTKSNDLSVQHSVTGAGLVKSDTEQMRWQVWLWVGARDDNCKQAGRQNRQDRQTEWLRVGIQADTVSTQRRPLITSARPSAWPNTPRRPHLIKNRMNENENKKPE